MFIKRFTDKINYDGPQSEYVVGKCWLWTAGHNGNNYGTFLFELGDKNNGYAHRYSWQIYNNKTIPLGYEIDHLCFNRLCVNPAHLECVTSEENKRRYFATITHCLEGHEYTKENTKMCYTGGTVDKYWCRQCITCDRANKIKRARAKGVRQVGTFRSWNAKLNEQKVKEIREKYMPRVYSQTQLAKEYGVSQRLISMVLRREIWDDVA